MARENMEVLPADKFFPPEVLDKIMANNRKLWADAVEEMALRAMIVLKQSPRLSALDAVAMVYHTTATEVRGTPMMIDVLKQVRSWAEVQ